MAIYVDSLIEYGYKPYKKWCHMTTDGDLRELHSMAIKIGLKREWFQEHSSIPHYDLVASKRRLAIRCGAIEVSIKELFEKCLTPTSAA